MSPQQYEAVVSEILAGIRAEAGELANFLLGTGSKNRLSGASGYRHQIDVSLAGSLDTYLVECKRFAGRVGVEEILVLAARGSDIAQAQQGVAVHCILATTQGITRGAKTLAEFSNIQVEIVQSAQEFGMKIGKRIRFGLLSRLQLGDNLEILRNGAG